MSAFRKAIEGLLPWYSPEVEAAKDAEVDKAVKDAKTAVDKLAGYARVRVHR